ncbi:DUF2784 domain-containing protein [Saccharothrix coeruleofusca]|uniref:DUF2784 domain-containing protein n=1 Tax=Saccharothrix coeruleofusca TaxID=33919 RepID=A0A918EHB4_9PSEU|nr:DUF2784 domain-containing protein [Saccharothrix coeruleofusca]MBP2339769.1 hypothetical protein [Saccharothrix coeruleofusca]GGP80281.1 hypothetical protein GCM10010185_62640 [Saccharothrix coeruleofusca]
MVARAFAELVMVLHFAVLLFLVVGGFLAWRWPKVIWAHAAMAAWAVLVVVFPLACPLTAVEDFFRVRAGQEELAGGFIDTYVDGVLYPESAARAVQLVVALLVLVSWTGYYLRRRAGHAASAAACR